jgi:hypothetical protein
MTLLATLQALGTALTDVITKTAAVQTALSGLVTFLNATL